MHARVAWGTSTSGREPCSGDADSSLCATRGAEGAESPGAGGDVDARPECYRRAVPAPRRYVTDAIVLSRFDLGEADRVLTLITPGLGKIKAIAKGVRRPTSRLGGSLEPFAELNIALARGRTFDVVTEVRVGHAWLQLRDRLESAATAWYLAEMADRSLEERHAAEPLYALLHRAYELLDAGMAPGRVARWYEMHLADELGQRPEVDRCVECDRMLEATEAFRWVPPLGGVLCGRCPGPAADRAGALARGAQAAQGVPAPGHRGDRRPAARRGDGARGRGRDARLHARRARARPALARVPGRGPIGAAGASGDGLRREDPWSSTPAPTATCTRSSAFGRT